MGFQFNQVSVCVCVCVCVREVVLEGGWKGEGVCVRLCAYILVCVCVCATFTVFCFLLFVIYSACSFHIL